MTRARAIAVRAAVGLTVAGVVTGCSAAGSSAPTTPGTTLATAETPAPAVPEPTAITPGSAPASPSQGSTTSAGTPTPPSLPSQSSPASPTVPSGSSTAPPTPSPAPTGAFILGDSISLSVAPALSQLGYPVTGRVGQSASTEFLRTHLASEIAQAAPAWVIVLGTNNRGDEADLERLDEWLRTIRTSRSGPPRQHVYWVTPHRPPEYSGGMSTHTLDAFNAALARADAERPWLTVLDFASLAAQNPEWYEQDGARLHPDERGQSALIDLIAGPGARTAETPAPITEIPRPTPAASPSDMPGDGDAPQFPDMEFTNE